jgi:osmotically-inducible protein OsmY
MRNFFKILSLVGLKACLMLSASVLLADTATPTQTVHIEQQLQKKIHDKLKGGWFTKGYPGVSAQIVNGDVTLTGVVASTKDKEKIDKEIREIEGVRSLNSQIRVENPTVTDKKNEFPQDSYKTPQDEQLNKKIREKVSEGWVWDSYKNVTINTDNGVVTIGGSIKNLEDQNKLVNEIEKINGVKSVISNLTVREK